jgi:orotidine-5'-phosphate decarboxylase
MNRKQLTGLIRNKRSFLCVGLDSDMEKIPASLKQLDDPVFEFNRRIIDATLPYTVAYKPNLAFYEASGSRGMISLEKTINYLNALPEKVLTIADAKRGDIGNSASYYAKAFFETLGFDAVTVSPYMGGDTIEPFLRYKDKWTILLALTSNAGAEDFQMLKPQSPAVLEKLGVKIAGWKRLFEIVMEKSLSWGSNEQIMFVVGATQADLMKAVREIAPDTFLLVPGVGAQGGSLEDVAGFGFSKDCGLLVNASRSIIFASGGDDFEEAAALEAQKMQRQMEAIMLKKGFIS